ncbi:MAG: methyltransferase family protein [Candidatus Hodarchaeales archaeon]|jgi:protein-S-isoprenylcysteine O-methyltransferase Ste14
MSSEHQHGIGAEHPQSHLVQFFCLVFFLAVLALDLLILQVTKEIGDSIPLVLRFSFFSFLFPIALVCIRSSHDNVLAPSVESKRLVVEGVYSYVRHPMYFGTLLIYLAFIILSFSLVSVIPLVISLFLYNIIAKYEEKELEKIFGAEYLEYKRIVNRWFPIINKLLPRKN